MLYSIHKVKNYVYRIIFSRMCSTLKFYLIKLLSEIPTKTLRQSGTATVKFYDTNLVICIFSRYLESIYIVIFVYIHMKKFR